MASTDIQSGPARPNQFAILRRMLVRDKLALAAAIFLVLLLGAALLGPWLMGEMADKMNLGKRNLVPFDIGQGWPYILGADSLGRPILARIVVGAQSTLLISGGAVVLAVVMGGFFGIIAGYVSGWTSQAIMRVTDVLISFPSLLLALIVLYIIGPSLTNVVLILAVTRLPLFIRTARAQVLEIRERAFISAARSLGVSPPVILFRHVLPQVLPTLLTLGALDFAAVLLMESGLSFLGLGVQPPEFTWGVMVASGRNFLQSAWWLSFMPGVAIVLTTLSLNILSNWARIATDPQQRWRLLIER